MVRIRHPRICAILIGALVLLPAVGLVAQGLPSRLSDDLFWKMVTEFSEPTGFFPSENFASNEVGAGWVVPDLLRSVRPGGVYLGVGPEQNFSYIAALQPKMAFIVDIRRQALLQQLYYKMLFEMAPDRMAFLSLLFSRPRPARLPGDGNIATILEAFDQVPPHDAIYNSTLNSVLERLLYTHRFGLSLDDIENLRHISQVLFLAGPHLSYTSARLLGRAAQPSYGTTSSLEVSYRRGAFGTTDTVRFVVSRSPTGRTDTTFVEALGPGGKVARPFHTSPAPIDFDSLWANGGRVATSPPRDTIGSTDYAALAAQILKGMPKAALGPTASGTVDFSTLMVQVDSAMVTRSFLATDGQYAVVRELQLRNLIVPLVGDFAGPVALKAVGKYLRDRDAVVSAFYTSNVEEYLFQFGSWKDFYANVAALPVDRSSTFIRAFLGGGIPSARNGAGRRVDLALGSIPEALQAFVDGRLTSYTDLIKVSRE